MDQPALPDDRAPDAPRPTRRGRGSSAVQTLLAFGALIAMVVVFSIASSNFLQFDNIVGILLATTVNGVLALGVTFVIIAGGIDLSIGTVMSLSAVMAGVVITGWQLPIPLGIVAGLATGAAAGTVNGFVIARLRLPPFIVTLGMLKVANGLALIVSGLRPIYFTDTPSFNEIAMGSIVAGLIPSLELPNLVLFLLGSALIAGFALNRTILGRYTFALGSNEEATRLSGVPVVGWKIAVYAVSGLFAGLAGLLMAARLDSAQPSLGFGYELEAIAAAVIGGTSLSGGEGTILGTVIGAFLISILTNGLRILSVSQEWQNVVIGVIVVIAVYLDIVLRRARQRA
jgi:ribose transport system permease protein